MSPKMATALAVVLVLIIFGGRFIKIVPPGHVGVAVLFGQGQRGQGSNKLHLRRRGAFLVHQVPLGTDTPHT